MFISSAFFFCKVSLPSSDNNFCMLHNFVAQVIILAASIWIVSNLFLLSVDALSQTESQYSRSGRIKEDVYIYSSAILLILNLRDLRRFRRNYVFLDMFSICSVQVHDLESVIPSCLRNPFSVKTKPAM